MTHIKVTLTVRGQDESDVLLALLAGAGYEGFEEKGQELLAYIPEDQFDASTLTTIANAQGSSYRVEKLPAQNWNEVWEANFEPVVVDNFCTIRASFHDIKVNTPHKIMITPKMSFGTGHHATTQLMITLMRDMDFRGKSVLDFGTGTGVLAILAEQLGAADVLAIDNDEWSVENAGENIMQNHCSHIRVLNGSLETVNEKVDIILANINRNILLQHMAMLYQSLNNHGIILMSGLLQEDEQIILQAAERAGFKIRDKKGLTNWIAINCYKT